MTNAAASAVIELMIRHLKALINDLEKLKLTD